MARIPHVHMCTHVHPIRCLLWVSCFVGRGETTSVLISFSEGNSYSHPSWLFWPSDKWSPAFSWGRGNGVSRMHHAPTCGVALCTVLPRLAWLARWTWSSPSLSPSSGPPSSWMICVPRFWRQSWNDPLACDPLFPISFTPICHFHKLFLSLLNWIVRQKIWSRRWSDTIILLGKGPSGSAPATLESTYSLFGSLSSVLLRGR
jgi:hypothetical protein